jgi:CrcB protein
VTALAFLFAAAVGAPARYVVDGYVTERHPGAFPWGTFAVNATGCFVLGVITGLALYHGLSTDVRTAAGTGGLGAYTTFSAFSTDTIALVEGDRASATLALRNVAITIVGCISVAAIGIALTSL